MILNIKFRKMSSHPVLHVVPHGTLASATESALFSDEQTLNIESKKYYNELDVNVTRTCMTCVK